MKAWVYQDPKQVKKLGEEQSSWYVGWYDPEGKRCCQSCGLGSEGKKNAEKLRKKREAELITGTYQSKDKTTWEAFRKEYETKVMDGMGVWNREMTARALDRFEKIVNPKKVSSIQTTMIADYVAKRRGQRGSEPESKISPATINKELRHLRAVFRKAHKWGYLPKLPDIEFLKVAKKLPTYITPEHFALIYQGCDQAKRPVNLPYPAEDWWRGLLIFAYMTGWRIGSILALRREDVDLEEGTALSRAEDNKGKRDQKIPLHPIVVEHLKKLPGFSPVFFPWTLERATLFKEFARIQKEIKIKPVGKDHYTFHDFRRAFATMNADKLTADALQHLMQHQDYQTTQRYINMARQLNPAVQKLFVPDLTPKKKAEGA